MRSVLPVALPGLLLLVGCSGAGSTSSVARGAVGPATISVYTGAGRRAISPLIFGVNIEWTENGNRILDPRSQQLRSEILAQLAPLRIPVYRFPGGILSDYYHWSDGVGPVAKRPGGHNPMDGTAHANTFGTDEFIALCKTLHAQPLITANAGSGTVTEARAWQQHFQEKGLPVRYWEIGNEIYLAEPKRSASIPGNDQRIFKTAAQYASTLREYRSVLQAADHDSLIGGIAGTYNTSKENRGWLDTLIAQDAAAMDFVSLHDSFAPIILSKYDFRDEDKRNDAYLASYAQAAAAAEDIAQVRARLAAVNSAAAQRIAITEHFPLFGAGGSRDQLLAILDQSRTMAAAAYTASLFHTYMREGVWMANYNLAVSQWFGALVLDSDEGIARAPVWYVFDLYRNHFGTELVAAETNSPLYATRQLGVVKARRNVPYLDAVASRDSQGAIYLAVINRHPMEKISCMLILDDKGLTRAKIFSLAARVANAVNGKSLSPSTVGGAADAIALKESNQPLASGDTYKFPPASVTIIQWEQPRTTVWPKTNGGSS